jgi:phospholipase C
MTDQFPVSRRTVLGGAMAGAAAIGLTPGGASASRARSRSSSPNSRGPGTLPDPSAPEGSDQLPQITNIVALMMENHTYDSLLGMLPPGRGDGYTRDASGQPTNSNPWPRRSSKGPAPYRHAVINVFPMPTPCQEQAHPYNTWGAGQESYHHGKMDGFVKSKSGPVSMGYYDQTLMPFINSLAMTFPICDRYFSSVMAQTYPNRRFAMAGTALGLLVDKLSQGTPPNGTIFESLNAHGISWKNYYSSLPSVLIYSYLFGVPNIRPNLVNISEFFTDAANGTLPAYSVVDPNFGTQSEEDPQDVQYGDQFMSQVINAVMNSPQWPGTLLVWTYDEGGGYYDHVPPPAAVSPDSVTSVPYRPGAFSRYGFRVPAGVVSPFARPDYVSSVVQDHTSILKLVETKWNLPALTYRDANAANLLDSIDLVNPPAFLTPPTLAAPPDPASDDGCQTTGSGTIPPPSAIRKA